MKKKKETRGGARQGSGAKPKYNEVTTTVAFRVPESKREEFRQYGNEKLKEWKVKREKCKNQK